MGSLIAIRERAEHIAGNRAGLRAVEAMQSVVLMLVGYWGLVVVRGRSVIAAWCAAIMPGARNIAEDAIRQCRSDAVCLFGGAAGKNKSKRNQKSFHESAPFQWTKKIAYFYNDVMLLQPEG